MRKTLTALLLGAGLLGLAGTAAARVDVGISLGFPAPVYAPPPVYYPRPAYVAAPPVYVAPAPVYYGPPAYYYGPRAYYGPPAYYYGRGGHRHHYR